MKETIDTIRQTATLLGYRQAVTDELEFLNRLIDIVQEPAAIDAIRDRCRAIETAAVKGAFWD